MIDCTRYHNYAELAAVLRDLERLYPQLVRVLSAGRSLEGRDILYAEITNRASGAAADKPAYHINGNHHAGEVTGSMVALYTLGYLATGFGADPEVTALLDTRALYILPRIAVDGAELYLTTPHMLRSSVRLYPDADVDHKGGLHPEDVDGDGRILQMRVPDPNGEWRVSRLDPRLMVRRAPDEVGGAYYRVYTEGLIRNYDGGPVLPSPGRWGIDFNRNYPANWALEHRQRGSGLFPFSEPETRAVATLFDRHPNITGAMAYHTTGGVLLRPMCADGDEKMPPRDLAVYRALGERGEEITGYPCWQVFEKFTYNPQQPEVGSFPEWAYEHLGIVAFETELWDPAGRAGIPKRDLRALREVPERQREEEAARLLAWNDRELAGEGFIGWRAFSHPQLGEVEIGGWEPKFVRQNPPGRLLPEECHKNCIFALKLAAASPLLKIREVRVERVEPGGGGAAPPAATGESATLFKVRALIENQGYLPTYVTDLARKVGAAKPITARLTPAPGVTIVFGGEKVEAGQLEGRAAAAGGMGWGTAGNLAEKRLEWLLRGPAGFAGKLADLRVQSVKAGADEAPVLAP
jgi:murein tripeptide amidase MpaA